MTIYKAYGTFAVLYLRMGVTAETDSSFYPLDFSQKFGKFIINETSI